MGHPASSGVSIKIELESDMSVRTFMTSFWDGLTGEGIFGDLRIPGLPDRIFKEEPEQAQSIKEGGELNEQAGLHGPTEKFESTKGV